MQRSDRDGLTMYKEGLAMYEDGATMVTTMVQRWYNDGTTYVTKGGDE